MTENQSSEVTTGAEPVGVRLAPELRMCAVRLEELAEEYLDQKRDYAVARELLQVAHDIRRLSEAALAQHRQRATEDSHGPDARSN